MGHWLYQHIWVKNFRLFLFPLPVTHSHPWNLFWTYSTLLGLQYSNNILRWKVGENKSLEQTKREKNLWLYNLRQYFLYTWYNKRSAIWSSKQKKDYLESPGRLYYRLLLFFLHADWSRLETRIMKETHCNEIWIEDLVIWMTWEIIYFFVHTKCLGIFSYLFFFLSVF